MTEKWKYCKDHICPYCGEDLDEWTIDNNLITGCPNCHRSFVE